MHNERQEKIRGLARAQFRGKVCVGTSGHHAAKRKIGNNNINSVAWPVIAKRARQHISAANLPWKFEPVQSSLDVKVGENTLAYYRATNTSDRATVGTAVFNVTPDSAGPHFSKVQCFCFTEQRLEPGQSVEMPVSFFVDPTFVTDEETAKLPELTLSYSFYPVTAPKVDGQASIGAQGKGG